jgi:replicative DNA helicase
MITGPEGFGKSTLVRQLAITAAAGIHPFREYPIEPARVLVIDAENTEKQWARETSKWANSAETITSENPSENMQLACVRRLDLSKDIDLGQVHRLIDQHQPDVLFIGPLYRLIPRAINSDDDAAPLLANLDTIRDRGIALVIEAHAGHATNPKGERDLRPRGSAALLGWPEFGLGLRRNAKNPLHADLVRWRGDRDQRGWPGKLGRAAKQGDQRWPWRPVD